MRFKSLITRSFKGNTYLLMLSQVWLHILPYSNPNFFLQGNIIQQENMELCEKVNLIRQEHTVTPTRIRRYEKAVEKTWPYVEIDIIPPSISIMFSTNSLFWISPLLFSEVRSYTATHILCFHIFSFFNLVQIAHVLD